MTDPQRAIFISYRRRTSQYLAMWLADALRGRGYDVFYDMDSIGRGEFASAILNQIAARPHFILMLAHGTLDGADRPSDWVRKEAIEAIRRKRNIIPFFVEGYTYGADDDKLTGELAPLKDYQAVTFYREYRDAALDRLERDFLTLSADGDIAPTPAQDQAVIEQAQTAQAAQAAPVDDILDAETITAQAIAAYDSQAYEEALRLYEQALAQWPDLATAYVGRGATYYTMGNLDAALTDFNEAIRLDPTFALAYSNRGNVYADRGDLVSAILNYDEAIRHAPDFPDYYSNRGTAHVERGDIDKALADYEQALQLDDTDPAYYYNRGEARQAAGQYRGAIADFEQFLSLGGADRYGYGDEARQAIEAMRAELDSE